MRPRHAAAQRIGVSVSVADRSTANERVVTLLPTRAAIRFLAYGPMIGPKGLTSIMLVDRRTDTLASASGHKARHIHTDWVRELRDEREYVGVPFFKQWEGWAHRPDLSRFQSMLTGKWQRLCNGIDGVRLSLTVKEGKNATGRLVDARAQYEFPESANE